MNLDTRDLSNQKTLAIEFSITSGWPELFYVYADATRSRLEMASRTRFRRQQTRGDKEGSESERRGIHDGPKGNTRASGQDTSGIGASGRSRKNIHRSTVAGRTNVGTSRPG